MDDVGDAELIIAAFMLGADIQRQNLMQSILGLFKLQLTPEMVDKLAGFEPGITLFGYEKLVPITHLDLPDEIITKFLAARPRLIIAAQLIQLTKQDLASKYGLTDEEIVLVKQQFDFGVWHLRPSPPTD